MTENTTDELVRLAVRINRGLARQLKVAAAMRDITIQDLVAQAIEKEIHPDKELRLTGILEDVEQGTDTSGDRYATAYLVHPGGRQYLQADGAKMADKLKEGAHVAITGKRDANPAVFVQAVKVETTPEEAATFDELDAIAAQARKEVRRG
jgi:hypothetical protein